jgi:archaellum component FlaC
MQCHRIMLEFERVNYRGHHGVVTEMNLFLLMERVDPELLTCNDEKIKRLKGESKNATAKVKRLDEKYKKLERDYTNLNTAVATLRTKVNKP